MLRTVPILIWLLFAADSLLAGAYLVNYAVGHSMGVVNALLNLDGELSLATWYSSVKFFAVAFALGLLTLTGPFAFSWIFAALALVFLGLSADEIIQIHEYAGAKLDIFLPGGNRDNSPFSESGIWMFVVGLPAVAAIAALFWRARSCLGMAPASFVKCLAGLAVFAAGAMGMETLGNFVEGAMFVAFVAIEELLEMIGVTITLWGVLELLAARGVRLDLGSPERNHFGAAVLS